MKPDVEQLLRSKGYELLNGEWWPRSKAVPGLPHPVPEPNTFHEAKGSDAGEVKSTSGRVLLSITSHRVKLCDADNLAGGCKFLIDALRYNHLIPGDSPDHIDLLVKQVKVEHYIQEYTEISIENEKS